MSFVIEDMYYSLEPKLIPDSVSNDIHEHGICHFQNSSGVSVEGFIDLIDTYLQSTLVEYEGNIYSQKKGVCIGSCPAPVLSKIVLLFVDRAINDQLKKSFQGCLVFRYVDDYLVIYLDAVSADSIFEIFKDCAAGLTFTRENPSVEGLQFLDLRLHPHSSGVCWTFQ